MNADSPTASAIGRLARCLDSFWLDAPPSDLIGRALRAEGIWERPLTRWMLRMISPGSRCVDIGMNNGYFSEIMARLAGPSGAVWAFEPRAEAVARYRDAQEMNCYATAAPIIVHEVALGDRDHEASMQVLSDNEGASTLLPAFHFPIGSASVSSQPVSVRRLDSIMDAEADIIKIDAEGSEPMILEGLGPLMRRASAIVLELHPSHSAEFISSLHDSHHVCLLSGEPLRARTIPYGMIETVQMRPR